MPRPIDTLQQAVIRGNVCPALQNYARTLEGTGLLSEVLVLHCWGAIDSPTHYRGFVPRPWHLHQKPVPAAQMERAVHRFAERPFAQADGLCFLQLSVVDL